MMSKIGFHSENIGNHRHLGIKRKTSKLSSETFCIIFLTIVLPVCVSFYLWQGLTLSVRQVWNSVGFLSCLELMAIHRSRSPEFCDSSHKQTHPTDSFCFEYLSYIAWFISMQMLLSLYKRIFVFVPWGCLVHCDMALQLIFRLQVQVSSQHLFAL